MEDITVQKADLIKVMKVNRDAHRAAFEQALDGWHKTVIATVERLYEDAKKNKDQNYYLSLPRPEDHTSEYDRRIQMYEMDINSTVILEEHEFAQFVQDDWHWKQQWTTSNSTYLAASTAKKK